MAQQNTTKTLDDRFDEVTAAIVEQRDYTTFAFDKVRGEVRQVEKRLTRRLDRHELLLGEVLDGVRRHGGVLVRHDEALSDVLSELKRHDGRLTELQNGLKRHDAVLSEVLSHLKQHDGVLSEILNEVKTPRR